MLSETLLDTRTITTKFMLLDNAGNYNTGGRYYLAPFSAHPAGLFLNIRSEYLDYIKGTWFHKEILKMCKPENPAGPVLQPIPPNKDLPCSYTMHPDNCPIFSRIHKLHLDWYDATRWSDSCLPPPTQLVKYNSIEEEELFRLATRYINFGSPSSSTALDTLITHYDLLPLYQRVQQAINTILQHKNTQCKDGVFIKLANFSPKKTITPYPITTANEAFKYLLSSPRCQAGLGCRAILIRPWEPAAAHYSNEFRAFIQNHKLVGISQQDIYQCYPEMTSVYSRMPDDIAAQIQELWDNTIRPNTDYRDGTLDVYFDTAKTPNIQLIEINPYGSWSGAGSAWYEWVTDPPEQGQPLEFRITTNIPLPLTC